VLAGIIGPAQALDVSLVRATGGAGEFPEEAFWAVAEQSAVRGLLRLRADAQLTQ
jgi:hypothetical protein